MGFFDIFRISQIKNEKTQLELKVSQLQKKLGTIFPTPVKWSPIYDAFYIQIYLSTSIK